MRLSHLKTWISICGSTLLILGGCFGMECGPGSGQNRKTLNLWNQFYSLLGQSEFSQAANIATQIIKRTPKDPVAYQQRALVLMQIGRHDEAIADFSKSLSLGSKDPNTYSLRSTCYYLTGQYDRALADANAAIGIDPKQWPFYYGRAEIYYTQGQLDLAQSDLNQAIKLNPECGEAYFHLAFILHKKGEREKARDYFAKANEIQPEILTRREHAQKMAKAREVLDFFEEEATTGSDYIYGEIDGDATQGQPAESQNKEAVSINIYGVSAEPSEVRPGEEFELKVDYMITDSTVSENELPYILTYSILENDEVRAESPNRYNAARGTRETQVIGLRAGRKTGTYTIKVILQYKDKIAGQSIKLRVK